MLLYIQLCLKNPKVLLSVSLYFQDYNPVYKWQRTFQFSLVSCVWLFATPQTAAHQASPSINNSPSLFKLMSLSQWCHPTISSSVVPFSSCLHSVPASGSFPMNWFFLSGDQSIGASASASVPSNEYSSFSMDWLDLLAVQGTLKSLLQHHTSKTSILWCSTFFTSNAHIQTWLLEKT